VKRERENLVSFFKDREISQLAGGLTPGFDHHQGLVPVVDHRLGVVDESHHLVENTLGGDLGEGLLAVFDAGFEKHERQVLNPRAFDHDPLLDSPYELDAGELVGVYEVAEIEVEGPIGLV